MFYFAYASNLNRQQMKTRCPDARPAFVATLPNYKLVFAGWSRELRGGKATILSSRGDKVRGGLYEVSEACLRRLDKYEVGYSRMNINVFDEDGVARQAVTYIKAGQLDQNPPSQQYGEIIRQGYRDWGIV